MLPDKIKILGHEYEVKLVTSGELEGCYGEMWFRFHTIKIDKDLPESRKESVLLHEIIETIDKHFELNLEHRVIECLEETLYAVLKDNNLLNLG